MFWFGFGSAVIDIVNGYTSIALFCGIIVGCLPVFVANDGFPLLSGSGNARQCLEIQGRGAESCCAGGNGGREGGRCHSCHIFTLLPSFCKSKEERRPGWNAVHFLT